MGHDMPYLMIKELNYWELCAGQNLRYDMVADN